MHGERHAMSDPAPSAAPASAERDDSAPPSAHAGTVRVVERAIVLLLLALLMIGVLRVLQPFAVAILFGTFIAIGTWPLREALLRLRLPRGAVATLLLVMLVLLVAGPALIMAPGLADQIGVGITRVREALAQVPDQPPGWVSGLPLVGKDAQRLWAMLHGAQGDLRALIEPYSGAIGETLVALGRGVAESLVEMLLALIVTTAFWLNGDRLADGLRDIARRLGGPAGDATVTAAAGALRGVAWGVVGTALLQGVFLGVGLAIAGVPGATTLGFLGFVCSASQILGPLVVACWAAAAWWLQAAGESGWALFMLLWGAILVSGSDNVVRPLLISRGSTMPLTLIILGVFGGMLAFGFLGLFVGPALLAVAHALIRAWREPRGAETARTAAPAP
jgi:predicted PurR-regulated permease PerM